MDSVKRIYKDRIEFLPISDFNNGEELTTALKRFNMSNLKLGISLANPALLKYFPHKLVSHLIWINKSGRINYITASEFVTIKNLDKFVREEALVLPLKIDADFDDTKPLLAFNHSTVKAPVKLYYSALTSAIPGISPPNGVIRDTINKLLKVSFYNLDLPGLCQMALTYRTGAYQKDFILHVKDPSRYFKPEDIFYEDWSAKNTYCYSLSVPLSIAESAIPAIIMADLTRWLHILGIKAEKLPNGKYQISELLTTTK